MHLNEKIQIISRTTLEDERGWFLKIINGSEDNLPQQTGEIYAIMAKPGETRAEHYHQQTCEWFTMIQGSAELMLEDVESGEQASLRLQSKIPKTIYVPHGIAHTFKNHGDGPFILIAYSDRQYDPDDTIPYQIQMRQLTN